MATPLTLEMFKEIVDYAWADVTDAEGNEIRVIHYNDLMKEIANVEKPPIVHSDWGSGTYKGWWLSETKADHDALVAEINRRARA